jgi:hypothetical protein
LLLSLSIGETPFSTSEHSLASIRVFLAEKYPDRVYRGQRLDNPKGVPPPVPRRVHKRVANYNRKMRAWQHRQHD